MLQQLQFSVVCAICKSAMELIQCEPENLGYIEVPLCENCLKDKTIKALTSKKADFDATYAEIDADVLAGIDLDGTDDK